MTIRRWGRAIGYHVLAASVLVVASIGGVVGGLVGVGMIDPRPLIGSDNHEFDASQHPGTAGYIGEVIFAAVPVVLISLAMIPLLRRAGSPAPRAAALAISMIPTAGFALLVTDSAIKDTSRWGCCATPGLDHRWWYLWIAAAIALTALSLITSATSPRYGERP
jgi:hypothetical protein